MNVEFYINQAQELKAKLDELRPLSSDTEAKIMQKLRLDWNFHSNHLEGNQLTYGETKALILHGLTAQGKPMKDHLETSGHDEAILMLEDVVRNNHPLTEHFIRELHVLILKKTDYKRSISSDGKNVLARKINIGVYKTSPNHVKTATGETFYFASPEETPAKMQDLIDWYRKQKENQEVNPILLASQFHYKFIRIHPFDDGNGRIARLLMNFILMQFGYPPAIIKTQDKENYFSALRQADAGNSDPFISYISENVIYTLELMLKGARGEEIEEPDDFDKQIALLENKLRGRGEKTKKVKNKETLKNFFKSSLADILIQFIKFNSKFNRFYKQQDLQIIYPYSSGNEPDANIFPAIMKKSLVQYLSNEYFFEKRVEEVYLQSCDFLLREDTFFHQNRFLRKYGFSSNSIKLEYKHFDFNWKNIGDFKTVLNVEIRFDKVYYVLIFPKSKQKISKLYHQKLTDEEIDYFLKKEAQKHLDFIQEKMKG